MKIKAGDRIVNLSVPWSGKLRYIKSIFKREFALIDLPNAEIRMIQVDDVLYNSSIECWEAFK